MRSETQKKRVRRLGYTLTELLISLAIIATVSGLALPAVIKIGGFLSSRSSDAARELYGVLRAARVYSITFRTDTAVVYTVTGRKDTYDSGWSYVVDGFGVARRANTAERRAILLAGYSDAIANNAYFPVETYEGRFQQMPDGTCVTGHADAQVGINADGTVFELPPQAPEDFRLMTPQKGMIEVFLFRFVDDQNGDGLDEIVELPYLPNPETFNVTRLPMYVVDGTQFSYPAHVFTATGDMLASDDSPAARFVMNVGPAPDAPLDNRFTVSPEEGANPVMVAPVRIELYRTTGRVKITS
ncbi:MAG TPA: type II secretion system protein [Candidatus Hydrogenedentes bacterium]|nr:type II secretion system protein [Candidatus Hydrogenedentota bacterium]